MAAHQRVDAGDDRRHLGASDHAVAVHVVQVERPAQLVVEAAARDHRQTHHEVLRPADARTPPQPAYLPLDLSN